MHLIDLQSQTPTQLPTQIPLLHQNTDPNGSQTEKKSEHPEQISKADVDITSPDVVHTLQMSIPGVNGNMGMFTVGATIQGSNNSYTVLRCLSKNAAICCDSKKHAYIIKGNMITNEAFNKEIRLTELLSKGSYKIKTKLLIPEIYDRTASMTASMTARQIPSTSSSQYINKPRSDSVPDSIPHKVPDAGYCVVPYPLSYPVPPRELMIRSLTNVIMPMPRDSSIEEVDMTDIDETDSTCTCSCLGGRNKKRKQDRISHGPITCDTIKSSVGMTDMKQSLNPAKYVKHTNKMCEIIVSPEQFDPQRIPEVIDTFRIDDAVYQITRFCGVDMFSYVNKLLDSKMFSKSTITVGTGIEESVCKNIFLQIATILHKLHKIGIAHGDISLENLCVDTSIQNTMYTPYIKIIDMGFAGIHPLSYVFSILDGAAQSGQFKLSDVNNTSIDTMRCFILSSSSRYGKLDYVSPERIRANYYKDSTFCMYKDDVYALGVVLFIMFMGFPPYGSIDSVTKLDTIVASELWYTGPWKYYIMNTIPAHALDLIRKLLKFEKDRISIDDVLHHPWLSA